MKKTKAAVAWRTSLIETVDLEGPKFGEVLVEIKATGTPRMNAAVATRHRAPTRKVFSRPSRP
jgi:Zn-dependent alcohol dehydrogenase